ncbi:response regulator transcription factor [Hymenobacter saemangeumensis]|uniref:Response regulator transcription factor n=1 Tax=Hymenobacter saemangeumensis TaxID=1084522 RepID=A0ABP8IT42_9BACT
MKVLLVEDDPQVASFVKKGFESEGYELSVAFDGRTGWSMYQQQPYDLVILDVNLPYLNGVELCQLMRGSRQRIPILLLTALDSLDDKEAGFSAGADDYLVKPFAFRELLLRVRALTKRYAETSTPQVLRLADLELNLDAKLVTRAGQRIDLTTREYSLLEHLLLNQGRIVSRVDIAERVWEVDFDTTTNIIDVYIGYLRKKIDRSFTPKLIHTVVGMGYVMRAD